MPYYSDPTLYSAPVSSYSLYLGGPYSTHSSLIASRSARPLNTYVKPLSRFHRGYAPHLATISENQNSLRRKYSPQLSYISQGSAKYKVPRPIKINTADIDVSADRYKPRISPNLDTTRSRTSSDYKKDTSKSPSPGKADNAEEFIPKPIRRDRPTVRLHTFHKDDDIKPKKLTETVSKPPSESFLVKNQNSSGENGTHTVDAEETNSKSTILQKNPSFHDICTVISQENIDEELNPGQPENIKRKQSRTLSNEDFFNQVRHDSAEILKENVDLLECMLENEKLARKVDKAEQEVDSGKDDNKFDPRGSVKRKKKMAKKKTSELISDEEGNTKSAVQKRPVKKIKRTSTGNKEPIDSEAVVKDISKVEVEEIKTKPKPLISATVEVEETKQKKPNLKFIVDDVKVEEIPSPKLPKKFKFSVTVDVKTKRDDKYKLNDENKGKVHIPKAKDVLVSDIRQSSQRASLGDIFEDIKKIVPKKTDKKHQSDTVLNGDAPKKNSEDVTKKLNHSIEEDSVAVNGEEKNIEDTSSIKEKDIIVIDGQAHNNNQLPLESEDTVPSSVDVNKTEECDKPEESVQNKDKGNTPLNTIHNDIMDTTGLSNGTIDVSINSNIDKQKLKLKIDKKGSDKTLAAKNNSAQVVQVGNVISSNEKQTANDVKPTTNKTQSLSQPVSAKKNENNVKNTKNAEKLKQPVAKNLLKSKKEQPSSPENKSALPPKEENESTENFWALIGPRESVYIHPTTLIKRKSVDVSQSTNGEVEENDKMLMGKNIINEVASTNKISEQDLGKEIKEADRNGEEQKEPVLKQTISNDSPNEEKTTTEVNGCEKKVDDNDQKENVEKKIVSKGSLVNKANVSDPDLKVFSAPPTPEPQEPESPQTGFTPLQSNRLSQWMHPWKKPEQFDECPVEIFARPKPIKGRHIPRPRHPQPPPVPVSQEDSNDSTEDTTESSEEETTTSDDEANVGQSTSSCDSGFNSFNGSSAMQRNKG